MNTEPVQTTAEHIKDELMQELNTLLARMYDHRVLNSMQIIGMKSAIISFADTQEISAIEQKES